MGSDNIDHHEEADEVEFSDFEMLDELTTNRGELKIRTTSFHSERWTSNAGRQEFNSRANASLRLDKHYKVIN